MEERIQEERKHGRIRWSAEGEPRSGKSSQNRTIESGIDNAYYREPGKLVRVRVDGLDAPVRRQGELWVSVEQDHVPLDVEDEGNVDIEPFPGLMTLSHFEAMRLFSTI